MKKRNRLTICLVAGVLILAVSATAAFGSVNGYSKYKEAVKALALETDNFTANGTLKMICDGKEVVHVTEDYAMDGHNMSSHSISKDSMGSHEQYETILNGVNTWFDVNDRYYYQSEYETDSSSLGGNLLGVDQDDEMARRMVNFMEIAADTVVGELKNNFVQVGKENGATLYQVEIAKNQVPSLVNAGLSLFAYSVGQSHDYDYTVNYEDYSATAIQNYEKVTGETLPETFKEGYINGGNEQWYEDNEELLQKVEEVNADNLESYIGQDMTLEKVLCNFGVDDKGNLTSNQITVNFNTTDQDGEHHTLVITGDVTISNYGTTTVQPLDVGDREKYA